MRLSNKSNADRTQSPINQGRRRLLVALSTGAAGIAFSPLLATSKCTQAVATSSTISSISRGGTLPGMVDYFLRGLEDVTGLSVEEIKQDRALRQLTIRTFSGWQYHRGRVFKLYSEADDETIYNAAFGTMKTPFKHATNIAGTVRASSAVQTTSNSTTARQTGKNHSDVKAQKRINPTPKNLNLEIESKLNEINLKRFELEKQRSSYEDWKKNGLPFDRIPGTKPQIQEALETIILETTKKLHDLRTKEEETKKATHFLELEPTSQKKRRRAG